jgi:hypothetical protein
LTWADVPSKEFKCLEEIHTFELKRIKAETNPTLSEANVRPLRRTREDEDYRSDFPESSGRTYNKHNEDITELISIK